jgi:hypothetical protein
MGAYQAWLDALPPSLADSATAEALRSIRGGKWEATTWATSSNGPHQAELEGEMAGYSTKLVWHGGPDHG